MRKALLLSMVLVLCAPAFAARVEDSTAAPRPEGALSQGQWDRLRPQRPLLPWETLRGYRLFFHPDDREGERRWLGVGVDKAGGDLTGAWALVRPYVDGDEKPQSWLRLQGVYSDSRDFAALEWDGLYRGQEFPDKRYRFDVEARFGKEKKSWKVVAVKSKDHPRFSKIGDQVISDNPLRWDAVSGEYLPSRVRAFVSAAQSPRLDVRAKVHLPDLGEDFSIDGILVQARRADQGGLFSPVEDHAWECVCAQVVPADSPARKGLKTVRCWWDLSGVAQPQGLWELKVGLFHSIRHRDQAGPCDLPLLDEDRVWVQVRP